MKNLPLLLLASTLTAMLAARAETVLFEEGFSGSTVMSGSPAAPTSTSTDYAVMSSKNATGSGIGSTLNLNLSSGTSAGFGEMQALFTTNPVTVGTNEWITVEMTFQGTHLLERTDGTTQTLNVGLYNSGGSYPVAGGAMASGGMGTGTSFVTGYAQNWTGYVGRVGSLNGGNSSQIYTRDPQTDTTDENQDALFNNSGTGAFDTPTGQGIASGDNITLSDGVDYTLVLTVLNDGTNILVSQEIFQGVGTIGVSVYSASGTAPSGYEYATFDSLAFGARFSASSAPGIDVSKLTVAKYTKADLPALYNIQLNGSGTAYTGAGRIGSEGDTWNNIALGAAGVSLLDSSGAVSDVSLTSFSATNHSASIAGTGVGSPTVGLNDTALKLDWDGVTFGNWPTATLSLTGLPTNALVTLYGYGASYYDNYTLGSTWTLDPANGGASATMGYFGPDATPDPTGMDVTLAANQGVSWISISGNADASGNLTVVMTPTAVAAPAGGSQAYWQTYLNGLQLQVGGTAPSIIGLVDQSVEDGTTVILSPAVTGNPTPTYQWYENGTNMPGEINPSLTLADVTTNQNGNVYALVAENALGVASNSMTLTVTASVYSAMSVTAVSPTNGTMGICSDTPLTVTFSDSVSLGTLGSIKIYDASNPGAPVDTINAADGLVQQRHFPGDGQSFSYPTISISGDTATINPHFNVLTSNQTYYVTIDPKTFLDSGGVNFVGLTDTNAWRFSTKSGPTDPNNLVVNGDGSADFLTVQGAVNSIPGGNTTPRIINVRDGIYEEIVNISGKNNITIRGQSRLGTLIGFANNNNYQAANSGTTHARMSFKVNANDIAIDTLTLTNMTPQGGGQAEALMIEGNSGGGAGRCIINNADIVSRQDTFLANYYNSQAYFHQCTIRGNFDYIWGGGNVYFDDCNIHTITGVSSPNITAARTTTNITSDATFQWANPGGSYTANGMSFVGCTFTADGGVGDTTLAGSNGKSNNLVSWFGCEFSSAYVAPAVEFHGNYLWWQAENTQNGSPVTFANVTTHAGTDPEMLAATNVSVWLYGWTPQLLPNILSQPGSQSVLQGEEVNFTVSATGIPDPSYQWKHEGTNLVGETGATLSIASAQPEDAGEYTVDVSNSAGTVTSDVATLTVTPAVQPTVSGPTILVDGSFQFSFSGGSGQAYRVWASTNVALTPVTTTWTLLTNGVFGGGPESFTDMEATAFPDRFYLITVP